jgi:hypothetical protein
MIVAPPHEEEKKKKGKGEFMFEILWCPRRGGSSAPVTSRVLHKHPGTFFSSAVFEVFLFTQYSADDEDYGNFMIGRD